MTFDEVLEQVRELLQSKGRVAYRALKRRFTLDDEYLEDLKAELIDAEYVATDEDGKVLVWIGKDTEGEKAKRGNRETGEDVGLRTPNSGLNAGERRQLTVMFIDLVGSTILSQQLDPEDYHARVVAYQTACHQIIARYEGHIAQYLGDGVLVYFGYPTAHEEDAVRAVRSGMEIMTAVSDLKFTPPLQVRIGIHTGPVVVGEIGAGERTERLALGETPNIAARIQGQANPDEVMISAATYRLVEGLFACEDRGQPELKGVTTPLTLYRVVKESEAQRRFDVAVQAGLTPLVGREEELALLRRRWEQAADGEGQVVLLSGEAGVGKSRLVQEIKERVSADGATRIEFRCSPYHQNSAFYPLIEHVQQVFHFAPSDTPHVKLQKLEQTLARYRFPQRDTIPLLTALLSLPHPEATPPLTLTPQQQKQRTLDALLHWLFEEAERAPVYTVWEDLHWADPSTLEFLALCLDQVPTARMLMLVTFRPEFTPAWTARSHVSHLVLSRLGRKQTSVIVEQIAGGKALSSEVLHQIVAKTDGVPLFVEELTKTVLESVESIGSQSSRAHQTIPIPATLQDSLMARLDRLGTAKEVAQQGAVMGRELTYELLSAISPLTEAALQQELAKLVAAELLYQRGLPPRATYLFKHALIQDTAYQSLLKSKRQQYHQQIAQVLEAQFPETKETQPELVAHHYTAAVRVEQAIPYWQKAGERAILRSANAEAISHLTKGLKLLKTLPDTPERAQRELTLQLALGTSLVATKGLGAPEVEQTYDQALVLCQQLGEAPQLFPVLFGLRAFYLTRGEVQTARQLAEQCLTLAQSIQDSTLLLLAHMGLGAILYYPGEFVQAREHCEQGLAIYNPQQHSPHISHAPYDPGVICLFYAGWALWCLGYPEQALKRTHEALTLAQELSHPFSLVWVLSALAQVHQFRQEGQASQERAEAVIVLSNEQGFAYFAARGTIHRGETLALQGQTEEGISQMRQGWAGCLATGGELGRPYVHASLAEVYGKAGQTEEGLNLVAEGLDVVQTTGQHFYEAELYRLKGTLTLQKFRVSSFEFQVPPNPQPLAPNPQAEAEACFLKAIEIARKQQAKSLELRAVMSLSRLWQQQGKQKEAHDVLSEIYGWFTEGFDTKDLQEAKALLAELLAT